MEPTGEEKLAGQATETLLLPPAQKNPALHLEHGLVPEIDPLPKYPG
jgi:hypothetical protein